MNSWVALVSSYIQSGHYAALVFDTALKSLAVLALAGGVCALWRRASAATRHMIWFLAVASLPWLPMLSFVLPTWQRPLWSVSTGFDSGNQVSLALEFSPGLFTKKPQPLPGAADAPATVRDSSGGGRNVAARIDANWLVFGLAAWLAGVALVLAAVVIGQLRLRIFFRTAAPLQSANWTLLLNDARRTLHLQRAVVLLQSADDIMPLTWGWWRPVVLLPAEAGDWPAERRRIVLLHELAHVKRTDCLTQLVTNLVCAIYWFNPLVWLAARRMCIERERACDDLVLTGGYRASDYAGHLVGIALSFRPVPQVAAIAMARSSHLEGRIAAIVDGSRNRRLRAATAMMIVAVVGGITLCLGGCKPDTVSSGTNESKMLRDQQIARLETFSAAKEKQAHVLAAKVGEQFFPGFQAFFDAAIRGDWQTVTNLRANFMSRHPQYEHSTGDIPHVIHWQPVLEICLAYDLVVNCEPKYTQIAVDDIINSIPAGSIYFGGTDPGRGLPTAFCKSHPDADPFFTLTQNALADETYLQYLRAMYGDKIYTLTDEDSQKCFQDYLMDAQLRLKDNKLKPGEDVKYDDYTGRTQIGGVVAVMEINALLTRLIFDKNPDREFFIEESYAIDWMYPNLEPHGLIFRINRQPLAELPGAIIQRDHDYWAKLVPPMLGGWLNDDTSVQKVTAFAEKVFLRHDLGGFAGDPRFVQNDYSCKTFSKLRMSIAGLYVWRAEHAKTSNEKERMTREADFAFRQALALCPYSPEASKRYADFLKSRGREADASLVTRTAERLSPKSHGVSATP